MDCAGSLPPRRRINERHQRTSTGGAPASGSRPSNLDDLGRLGRCTDNPAVYVQSIELRGRRRRRKLDVQGVNAALSLDLLPVREVTPLGLAGRRFGVTSA